MKQKTKTPTRMPKLWVLVLVAFSLVYVTACKEENTIPPSHPLVGTWFMSAFDQTGCTNTEENIAYTLTCSTLICVELKIASDQTYQLKTVILDEPTETISGTYKIQGNNLEICEDNLYCSNGDFEFLPGNNSFTLTEIDGASGCVSVSTFTRK